MTRLGFPDEEAMRLSFGEFIDLYHEYQNVFDIENILHAAKKTYKGMREEKEKEEMNRPVAF